MDITSFLCDINLKRLILVLSVIINIFFILIMIKDFKELKRIKKIIKKSNELKKDKYVSEIPDEKNATPARALRIAQVGSEVQECSCGFAATIFDLCLKGIVNIKIASDQKIELSINDVSEVKSLSVDEKMIYELLEKAIGSKECISLDKLKIYAEAPENNEYFFNTIGDMVPYTSDYAEQVYLEGSLDTSILQKYQKHRSIYYIAFVIILLIFMCALKYNKEIFAYLLATVILCPFFYLGIFFGCSTSEKIEKIFYKSDNLTKVSLEWIKFKSYLTNYSKINSVQNKTEKIDIKRIEKLLIYAATFDVSSLFIDELIQVHPDILENYTDQNNGDRYDKFWKEICMNNFKYVENELHDVYDTAREAHLKNKRRKK